MKLSIAMIVKNEEKNIERTLIPLKKLSDYLECEIVIIDTGSDDKTVEIAKKYTNKIYFYKWNNNFSDMRNISIEYCVGEWILVVDGDEVLYDVKELAFMLKNKKIDDYNGAFIKIIDFDKSVDNSIKNGSVAPILRLFRKKYAKYIGAIHEQPQFVEPLLDSDIRFVHYGYDNSDFKLMEYKFERNIKLLFNELNKNPKDIYLNFQVATSYIMHGDLKEALKYIKIAYDESKDNRGKYIYTVDKYCLILYKLEKYDELVDKACEGIKYCDGFIDFYFYLGESLNKTNRKNESIKAYENYLKYYENKESKFNATLSISTKGYRDYILYNLALNYYNINNYTKSLGTLVKIKDLNLIKTKIILMLNIIIDGKIYNKINLLNNLIDNDNYEVILRFFHNDLALDNLKEISKVNMEGEIKQIINIIKNLKTNKYASKKDVDDIKEIIKRNSKPYSIYIYYLLKYDVNEIKNLLICYGKDVIEKILLDLCSLFYDMNEVLFNELQNIENSNIYIKEIIQKVLVLSGRLPKEHRVSIFLNYIADSYYCIQKTYIKEILEDNLWVLSKEQRFIIEAKRVFVYKYKDTLMYIREMKRLIKLQGQYVSYIKLLVEENKEQIINEGIRVFIPELIKMIKQLIISCNYQEAYDSIEEGLRLVEFDIELLILKYDLLTKFNYLVEVEECFRKIVLYGEEKAVQCFIRSIS